MCSRIPTLLPPAAGVLFCAGLLLAWNVGESVAAVEKDPMASEYYTKEEEAELSTSDRAEYCRLMEEALATLQSEYQRYETGVDSLEAVTDSLRSQSIEISAEIRDLNSELRELRLRRRSIQSYTTREGDTLRSVAKKLYGDPTRWKDLFEANRERISSEDGSVAAGIELTVPR